MPEEVLKNETTNAVLKEKIEGLTKLTDERFSTIKDFLARIEKNSDQYATKGETEEIKKDFNKTVVEIKDAMLKHYKDDEKSFNDLSTQNNDLKKQNDKLKDIMSKWIGGLTVISIALPFIIHYIWK